MIYAPDALNELDIDELRDSAGTPEDFKKGRIRSALTDIRGAGDMQRAQLMGKAPYFEVAIIDEADFRYQRIGIMKSADTAKLAYSEGFIEYLLSPACQKRLGEIGLLPVDDEVEMQYDPEWLNELRTVLISTNAQ